MHHSPFTTHHSPAPQASRLKPQASSPAFTLVELLIAMALTLILVYAIAHFYAIIGDAVKDGRGMIEMNQQLRAVCQRLQLDLNQITVPAVPWADEGGANGYLEINEGRILINPATGAVTIHPASDWDVNQNGNLDVDFDVNTKIDNNNNGVPDWEEPNVSDLLGDWDDWIGMTIRSGSLPFTGLVPQVITATSPTQTTSSANTHDGEVASPANPGSYTLLKSSNAPLTRSITSQYAEVAWWTSFSDLNGNGTWGLDEPRTIHRRQLLIRPDLNLPHPGDANVPSTFTYLFRIPVPTGANLNNPESIYLYDMYQYCDVSMRPERIAGGYLYFKANSLADLCKRQNRFMHVSAFYDAAATPAAAATNFPYPLDFNAGLAGSLQPDLIPDNAVSLANTKVRHLGGIVQNANPNTSQAGTQYRWVLFDGGRKGEDIMISNILAFDIRLFDTEAIVRSAIPNNPIMGVAAPPINANQFSAEPIQPGDAGYAYAVANQFTTTYTPYPALGTGAYVDLGYGIALRDVLHNLSSPHNVNEAAPYPKATALLFTGLSGYNGGFPLLGSSRFAGFPSAPPTFGAVPTRIYQNAIGLTWDSWTLAYERDGIDQDGDGVPDDATNGLDDPPMTNGVDDIAERETTPPYNFPLRGIQIRIRLYEPGTRQVRQATVENDFISE